MTEPHDSNLAEFDKIIEGLEQLKKEYTSHTEKVRLQDKILELKKAKLLYRAQMIQRTIH